MDWQTIREKYPHTWLVVEALDGRTENGMRVINELQVLETFGEDSARAWEYYTEVHSADRQREHYVLHTDRNELNIHVKSLFGFRTKR